MPHSITSSSWECSKFCTEQWSQSLGKSDTHCILYHVSVSCFYQGIWPHVLISKNFCPGDSFYMDHVTLRLWALHAVSKEGLRSESIFLMLLNIGIVKLSLESLVKEWRPCSLGFSIIS